MRGRIGTPNGTRCAIAALAMLLALALSASASATGPSNDNYPAPAFPVDTTWTQEDTSGAGVQQGEPGSCNGHTLTHTVWYRITGTGGPILVTTDDSDFDTIE